MKMKKFFTILIFSLLCTLTVFGQEEEAEDKGGKLQQRMKEYIQKRLGLSSNEAEKFSPIFLRYIVELRRAHRDFKTDRPVLQLKVAELRLRARNEFRQIMDEQRANKVFEYQREFEIKIREEINERRLERMPGNRKRVQALLRE